MVHDIMSPSVCYDGSITKKDTQKQEGCGHYILYNVIITNMDWKIYKEHFRIRCQTTAT